jgi:hypothetical protein
VRIVPGKGHGLLVRGRLGHAITDEKPACIGYSVMLLLI